jgi:ubiquinone/menaquinone biosynthesis C-methylase UbiE
MKIRESGMPNEAMWNTFFDPYNILKTLQLNDGVVDVAEFGCGYGTFTVSAAKIISGRIYAIDIEPEMLQTTKQKAEDNGLNNVEIMLQDILLDGSGLSGKSVDYVMLFNILHADKPEELLRDAYRILRVNGKLAIIHWNYDPSTPRGPAMGIRPKPEECIEWAKVVGFTYLKPYDLKPYHYGIVLRK